LTSLKEGTFDRLKEEQRNMGIKLIKTYRGISLQSFYFACKSPAAHNIPVSLAYWPRAT